MNIYMSVPSVSTLCWIIFLWIFVIFKQNENLSNHFAEYQILANSLIWIFIFYYFFLYFLEFYLHSSSGLFHKSSLQMFNFTQSKVLTLRDPSRLRKLNLLAALWKSQEANSLSTWSSSLLELFKQLTGINCHSWIPVLFDL